jgi:hypothetical protein
MSVALVTVQDLAIDNQQLYRLVAIILSRFEFDAPSLGIQT